MKSPFLTKSDKKDLIFQGKLKEFFANEKVVGALYFYGTKDGRTHLNHMNLCKHDLQMLSDLLQEESDNLEEDEM